MILYFYNLFWVNITRDNFLLFLTNVIYYFQGKINLGYKGEENTDRQSGVQRQTNGDTAVGIPEHEGVRIVFIVLIKSIYLILIYLINT